MVAAVRWTAEERVCTLVDASAELHTYDDALACERALESYAR